jgi:Delta14-sterol reductase
MTAFSTFLLALGVATGLIFSRGPGAFTFIYAHWTGIVTAAFVNSLVQGFFVYARSFRNGSILALGGNTGHFIYDVSAGVIVVGENLMYTP